MTTPAQDAPLVFPSVAFRPLRLLLVCAALTAVAVAASWSLGHPLFGVFFGAGLVLGLFNAILVQRAVAAITAEAHPLKKKMAANSATRLLVISAFALTFAIIFRSSGGIGILFGLALFQPILVISTSIPVLKKIRAHGLDVLDTESKDRADSND